MNRYEFVREIAARTGLFIKDAKLFEEAFEQIVTEKMLEGERVNLYGFGTFKPTAYKTRDIYYPANGETHEKEAWNSAKFHCGKDLLRMLNNQPTEEI